MQEGMLEQAEAYARHWIVRRQEAVETALEGLNEMKSTDKPDPVVAMQVIADWQRGSFERLTEDFREWMALCMHSTQLVATLPSEAGQHPSSPRPDNRQGLSFAGVDQLHEDLVQAVGEGAAR